MSANFGVAKIVSSLVIGSWIGLTGLALASCLASTVLAVPGFAQSNMLRASSLSSTDVVRVYVPVDARPAWSVTLPPNLKIPDLYRSYVNSMLRLSPTFRRQCVRIANALGLTVELRQFLTRPPERLRARTSFWTAPRLTRLVVFCTRSRRTISVPSGAPSVAQTVVSNAR